MSDEARRKASSAWAWVVVLGAAACGETATNAEDEGSAPMAGEVAGTGAPMAGGAGSPDAPRDNAPTTVGRLTLRADVQPVTRAADALPSVFIPPFVDCRDPLPGQTGQGEGGKVCTNVAISGCTEEGKYFPDYGACDVVRTQRPFWSAPPARIPRADDPRLSDAAFMGELDWMTKQVAASGCTCCHDSRAFEGKAGQWDIALGPIWLDTLSDSGLALFLGLADSSVLGAYPAADNHGFDRSRTGIPTTDTARMTAFLTTELARRGLTQDDARAVPPFGGPIYANSIAMPGRCGAGEGVTPEGLVRWKAGTARYLYVADASSANPGVPPNLDTPEGTLWRLDVLASAVPLQSGVAYGTTPAGSFQAVPESRGADALIEGTDYLLTALRDVGLPIASCVFTFGEPVQEPQAIAAPPQSAGTGGASSGSGGAAGSAGTGGSGGAPDDAAACGPMAFFGEPCSDTTTHSDCGCAADYCAQQPGQAQGYCTATDCVADPSVCPAGWSCFDISIFAPGSPAICLKP